MFSKLTIWTYFLGTLFREYFSQEVKLRFNDFYPIENMDQFEGVGEVTGQIDISVIYAFKDFLLISLTGVRKIFISSMVNIFFICIQNLLSK